LTKPFPGNLAVQILLKEKEPGYLAAKFATLHDPLINLSRILVYLDWLKTGVAFGPVERHLLCMPLAQVGLQTIS
jgi:hypothetical protein